MRPSRLLVVAVWLLAARLPVAAQDSIWTQRTDPQSEVALGRQVAQEVEKQHSLAGDETLQQRVRRVGSALVAAMPERMYPYEFKVLAVADFNAFALPGGFVYVHEGLLAQVRSDDALAFIMAHEIAHASHRHWAAHVKKMKGVSAFANIAAIVIGTDVAGLIASLAADLMSLSYSRDHERDADATGIEHLWRAGFNTTGALDAMKIIADLEAGKSVPKYLRSHPPGKDRLAALSTLAEELKSKPRPALPSASDAMAAALTALTGDLPQVTLAPNELLPLAVGNTWTYEVTTGGVQSTYTVRLAGALEVTGGAVYRAQTQFGTASPVDYQVLTTADAVWRRNRPASSKSAWKFESLLSAEAGREFPVDGCTFTVIGSESVTVPAGVFGGAVHLRKMGGAPASTTDTWYARSVGTVKRTCQETGTEEVLKAYDVKPSGTADGADGGMPMK